MSYGVINIWIAMSGIQMSEFPNLLQNDKLLVKMPNLNAVRDELQQALVYLT